MPKAGILLILLLAAGCAAESRERLKTLGRLPDAPVSRDSGRGGATTVARIDVTPANKSRRVNAEQVMIATVYDRDGKPKSRGRVEWTLEGPGKIVAVDEGNLLNRGKRVDPRFAIGYTSASQRTITGDRDDPRDDFDLGPGQTWCIVTSAEPGRTTLIAQSDDAKAEAAIRWTDGETNRPGTTTSGAERPDAPQVSLDVKLPKAVGIGRDVPVTISLANSGRRDSQPLTLKATVPDGVEIVRIDPPAIRRSGNTLSWAFERLASGESQEIVLVVKSKDRGPLNITASAESADGLRAEQRVGTSVDAAGMNLRIDAPATAATGGTMPVRVTVTNTGSVPVENAIAWVDGPDDSSKPTEKAVGTIPANESKTITVNVPVERAGKIPVRVNVTADGGLSDRAEATVQVGKSDLELSISGSESFPVGQDGLFEFRVTNRGDAPLANAAIQVNVPRPLAAGTASDGGRSSEGGATWTVGTLAAGESKVVRLSVSGDRISESVALTATADGELGNGQCVRAKEASFRVAVVGLPVLTMQLSDPVGPVAVGGRATYRVTVRNKGNAPARDVIVTANATDELRPARGSGPNRTEAKIGDRTFTFPTLGELPAGASAIYLLETDALKVGSARLQAAVKSREIEKPVQEEQATQIERKR
jgi:Domain of unknown function DUF11